MSATVLVDRPQAAWNNPVPLRPTPGPPRRQRARVFIGRRLKALAGWPTALALFYICAGAYFVSRGAWMGDAISRVEIARGVIDSYNPGGVHILGFTPHAAAIGFIWGPIVSGLEIPLVAFGSLWPWLVRDEGAGVIVSALFMAWGAYSFSRILREHGLDKRWCTVLTVGFALNPFIIFYACNGMSEAPYVALLLACVRRLASWQRDGRTSDLALAGLWVGLDYWVRYEPLIAAFSATIFVAGVTVSKSRKAGAERAAESDQGRTSTPAAGARKAAGSLGSDRRVLIRETLANALVFLLPVSFFVIVFSAISWWITGFVLEQAQSLYGASTQNAAAAVAVAGRVSNLSQQMLGLLVLLPIIVPIAFLIQHRFRNTLTPVICWVMGAPFLFDMLDMSNSKLLDLERYMILGIPIAMLLLSTLRHFGRRIGLALAVAGIAATWICTFVLTGNPQLAPQEYQFHQAMIGQSAGKHVDFSMTAPREVATYLDKHSPQPGTVLLDTMLSVGVYLQSSHPQSYVLPDYQGFDNYLAAPYQHRIRYLVTINASGGGALNAINRYYPGLFEGCMKNTQLKLKLGPGGDVLAWKVYKLTGPISPAHLVYKHACRIPSA